MTFTNTLLPVEGAAALGIALILLMALGYLLANAARLARELSVGSVRVMVAVLLLAGALLAAYVGWKWTGSGGGPPVTMHVEPQGLVYERAGQPTLTIPWGEVRMLTRLHAEGRDTWTVDGGARQATWNGSVGGALRLQNLVIERAELLHSQKEGAADARLWTVRWTRPPGT